MVVHERFDSSQLPWGKPEVSSQLHGLEPEFSRLIITIHVNVGGLAGLMAEEVDPVRATT